MAAIQQPAVTNDHGAELTVGILSGTGNRMAIVLPMATDNTTLTDINRMQDCVVAWQSHGMPQLLACMVATVEVLFIQAEGMVDGIIPYRIDFVPGTNPGTNSGQLAPTNVTGLITFYEDPADIAPGRKMRTARTFVPGVSDSSLTENTIDVGLLASYLTWGTTMQNGYNVITGSGKWYRMLSAPYQLTANPTPPPAMIRTRPRGIQVPRIAAISPRSYVATQKRRMVPR